MNASRLIPDVHEDAWLYRAFVWTVNDRLIPAAIRWLILAYGVGIAQLFRSDLEFVIGINYLICATILLVGTVLKKQLVMLFGFATLAVAFFARAIGALFFPDTDWTGVTIVLLAWITMSRGAGYWAYRLARWGDWPW